MRKKPSATPPQKPKHTLSPKPPESANTPSTRRLSFFIKSSTAKPETPSTTTTNLSPHLAQGGWARTTLTGRNQRSPANKTISTENIFIKSAEEMKLPFGEEYRLLNKIAFCCQQENQSDSEEILLSFIEYSINNEETLSAIGKKVYDQIKIFFKDISNDDFSEILKNENDFFKDILKNIIQILLKEQKKIEALLQLFSSGFPEKYFSGKQTASTAEKKFPSSEKDRIGGRFSHFLKNTNGKSGIIATDVPHEGDHPRAMNSFLQILWDYDVREICFIGFSPNRQTYQNTKTDQFETTVSINHKLTLSHHEQGSTHNKVVIRKGFSAQDQHSLVLSEEDLKTLLDLHELSKTEVVAIHCDSGVGRTGQLILLLKLLDLYESNQDFANCFNSLLNHITEEKKLSNEELEQESDRFFEFAGACLSTLRETRYFIEQEKQFSDILPLLMMVIAYQKNITLGARKKIDKLLPATQEISQRSLDAFGEMIATPPSSSGSGKLLPLCPQPPISLRRQGSVGSAGSAKRFFRGLKHHSSVDSDCKELKPTISADSLATPETPSSPC